MLKSIVRFGRWLFGFLISGYHEENFNSSRNHPSLYDSSAHHDDSLPGFSRHEQARLYIGHGWRPPTPPSGRLPVQDWRSSYRRNL